MQAITQRRSQGHPRSQGHLVLHQQNQLDLLAKRLTHQFNSPVHRRCRQGSRVHQQRILNLIAEHLTHLFYSLLHRNLLDLRRAKILMATHWLLPKNQRTLNCQRHLLNCRRQNQNLLDIVHLNRLDLDLTDQGHSNLSQHLHLEELVRQLPISWWLIKIDHPLVVHRVYPRQVSEREFLLVMYYLL